MKNYITLYRLSLSTFFLFLTTFCFNAFAQQGQGAFSIGARYHTEHSEFSDLPYGDGDISYMLAYEYSERLALWQLGVDFGPDVSGTRLADPGEDAVAGVGTSFVITPQLNLIFKDGIFRAGTGVLTSYIRDKEGDGEWIGPYWQLLFGLSFDLAGSMSLDAGAHYVLERWDKIKDFSFSDLEYSVLLSFRF